MKYLLAPILLLIFGDALALDVNLPGVDISVGDDEQQNLPAAIKVLLGLTVLSLAPSLLVMVTSFTRIIVVLSMMRQALGMQETPPNSVLISLALFFTLFSMAPVIQEINEQAYTPYIQNEITDQQAIDRAVVPIKKFMVEHTREKDINLMAELSGTPVAENIESLSLTQLIPAFMLSELKTAFEIGFIIFLPFVLVDLLVAGTLMSMGMLMVPPMMISLPIKVLVFVLIDGWYLVSRSLLGSFVT